jgi:hypothetical protein
MRHGFTKSKIALAVATALTATTLGSLPTIASAAKPAGSYASGDFHNHTTCSDGSISMQKLVKKATDKSDGTFGLDWFVQAGHGGNGNRNCTLVEDDTLSTPAYPFVTGKGPTTTWANSIGAAQVKGNTASTTATSTTPLSTQANPNMWRWQSVQEYQYPVVEYLTALKGVPVFIGTESVVAGHEHTSMSVITGQLPSSIDTSALPTSAGYSPLGNATALAQWTYCFDRNDTDNSRGGGQGWNCSVTGSLNAADPSWNAVAAKLVPATGTGSGDRGHLKTVEALKWMKEFHPNASYYVPAHLERAGPFNPDGNNGFNIEHLRNFNNAAPDVAFGFETQPGHGASSERGEYFPQRNTIGGVKVDSVGGTTYGGTGVYGAQIGGVWDALLGEGRNWWFFASSDWHNRGSFGPDDRRSTQDFFPGEYQRDYVMVRNGDDPKLHPQAIVDGLRSGNSFAASGQLIDRLAFVACVTYPNAKEGTPLTAPQVEALAIEAARGNSDVDRPDCATMGEKLTVKPGAHILATIVVRDPSGTNYSPYTFNNPSLAQVGIKQPLNAPALDHIDVIRGMVTGYKKPGTADYAGEWPRTWLTNPDMSTVPAAAKNMTAVLLRTFNGTNWKRLDEDFIRMNFRIPAVTASQYLRLRGTNLPPSVPYETDANGNPLADIHSNATTTTASSAGTLKIPCTVAGSNVPANGTTYTGAEIDGCPNHLPTLNGEKYVAYDVAAWSDLWFYSNPIFIEVEGATKVAGIK